MTIQPLQPALRAGARFGAASALQTGVASDDELVKVTDAAGSVEAGALRAFLEDNDIFVYVQGENHSSLLGPAGAIAIGLNIMVPRSQAAEAVELIDAYRNAEPIDPFEDDPELPEARVVKRKK